MRRPAVRSDGDGVPTRSRADLADARRQPFHVAVVTRAVLRRCLADDLREARAARAERCAANGEARVGDRLTLTKEGLGTLDATRHEVGVRRLPVRRAEPAREVCG